MRIALLASSAGNTRGLIEAYLKLQFLLTPTLRLPRGIPAASLKPAARHSLTMTRTDVFRGEYPRPH